MILIALQIKSCVSFECYTPGHIIWSGAVACIVLHLKERLIFKHDECKVVVTNLLTMNGFNAI